MPASVAPLVVRVYRLLYCTYARWFEALYDEWAPRQAELLLLVLVSINAAAVTILLAGRFLSSMSRSQAYLIVIPVIAFALYLHNKYLIGTRTTKQLMDELATQWPHSSRIATPLAIGVLALSVILFGYAVFLS